MSPFDAESREELYHRIKTAKVVFPEDDESERPVSDEMKDFILRLLEKDPQKRIRPAEIVKHPVFEYVNFEALLARKAEKYPLRRKRPIPEVDEDRLKQNIMVTARPKYEQDLAAKAVINIVKK